MSAFLCTSGAYGQQVFLVDDDAIGSNDGSSWESAFIFLQDALAQATSGDEIWVAAGTYRPDQGAGVATFDRDASFRLVEGVKLYGGFSGGETSVGQRDIEANPTILYGDLNGDDELVACAYDMPDCAEAGRHCFDGSCILKEQIGENSSTIVLALGVSASTILDGFTITGGNANEPSGSSGTLPEGAGAGMYIKYVTVGEEIVASEPIVRNCRFEWNSCTGWGAGIFTDADETAPEGPTITNSIFYRNTSYTSAPTGAALGGGLCTMDSHTTISDCTFRENASIDETLGGWGGAIGTQYGNFVGFPKPRITRCTFVDNYTHGIGGAMYDCHHNTQFMNCTFIGNRAALGGGYANFGGDPTVSNSIFIRNSATGPGSAWSHTGGGLVLQASNQTLGATIVNSLFLENTAGTSAGGIHWQPLDEPTANRRLSNTIVRGNTANGVPDQIAVVSPPGSEPKITFNNIEGGWTNADCPIDAPTCNIDADPLFVDAAAGNFELGANSPCIDAGDNSALSICARDFADNVRFMNDPATPDTGSGSAPIVDMGPYEFVGIVPDCNGNDVYDECDVEIGASDDCNNDFTPDDCQLLDNDCNNDLIPDDCQLVGNDCDANGVLDDCQPDEDCNLSGTQDICDIADGTSGDCNANQVPDECDIELSGLTDENLNGVPDDCEGSTNRYITLVTADAGEPVAYRVDMTASAYFPDSVGTLGWVSEPDENDVSRIADASVYSREWPRVVFIGDCETVPVATYEIWITSDGATFTDPVELATIRRPGDRWWYGDVVGMGTGALPPLPGFTGPNGVVNVTDVQAFLLTFQGPSTPSAHKTWVDMHGLGEGSPPNFILNVSDLQRILFGLAGLRYTDTPNQLDPGDCP
jgi:hypothetical protein